VAAQVEIQVGHYRLVSLLTREAVDVLALKPGMMAIATVKATNLGVDLPHTGTRAKRPA
jgi:molybdopterin-binding protein